MTPSTAYRRLARPILLAVGVLLVTTPVGLAHGEVSHPPSAEPATSAAAVPSTDAVASAAPASPVLAYPGLPDQVAVIPAGIPTVSVPPASEAGVLAVGTSIEYVLGHCGLWSPVDLDGSLWQPVGGQDAAGGAIAGDEAIGELINATPGTFLLLTPDTAEFRSGSGVLVAFVRAPGDLDYPLCM